MSTPPDTTTRHEYTDEQIKQARDAAMGEPSFKTGIAFLRAFLAALPPDQAERPQAQTGPWPGQQEAIDKAFEQINDFYLDCKSSCDDWNHEAPARLAIAQAYDAARPQSAEITEMKAALFQAQEAAKDLLAQRDKAQAELAALRQPILDDDGRSLGQVQGDAWRSADNAGHNANECDEISAQAVADVVLAQAVRRMEEVPDDELGAINISTPGGFKESARAVRACLIAAVKGEGKAKEIPQAEAKAEPATFEVHGKTWTRHTPGDPMPCEKEKRIYWLYRDTVIGSTESPDVIGWERNENKSFDIIGWCYADEPAQAEPEPAQPWTPAVGDVVRLKSGGPVMTVTSDNAGGHHTCTWFNSEDARITGRFPAACLTPAQP